MTEILGHGRDDVKHNFGLRTNFYEYDRNYMRYIDLNLASDISVWQTSAVIPTWSQKIRTIRRENPRWTQRQLADAAGVNTDTIHRAESGKNLEFATVEKIAQALSSKAGRDVLPEIASRGESPISVVRVKAAASPADDQGAARQDREEEQDQERRESPAMRYSDLFDRLQKGFEAAAGNRRDAERFVRHALRLDEGETRAGTAIPERPKNVRRR